MKAPCFNGLQNSYYCHFTEAAVEAQREELSCLTSGDKIVVRQPWKQNWSRAQSPFQRTTLPVSPRDLQVLHPLCPDICSTTLSKVAPEQAGLRLLVVSLQGPQPRCWEAGVGQQVSRDRAQVSGDEGSRFPISSPAGKPSLSALADKKSWGPTACPTDWQRKGGDKEECERREGIEKRI